MFFTSTLLDCHFPEIPAYPHTQTVCPEITVEKVRQGYWATARNGGRRDHAHTHELSVKWRWNACLCSGSSSGSLPGIVLCARTMLSHGSSAVGDSGSHTNDNLRGQFSRACPWRRQSLHSAINLDTWLLLKSLSELQLEPKFRTEQVASCGGS